MTAEANTPDPEETDEDIGDDEATPKKKKMSKKKLALVGGLGFLGLVIIGGGGALLFGVFDSMLGIEREKTSAELELGAPIVVEFPQIKADLKTGRCRAPFLRATVAVRLDSRFEDRIEAKRLEIMESIIIHLRDQERQDLTGKAGSEQLKFDMVRIFNNILAPGRVQEVIFKELLLQ